MEHYTLGLGEANCQESCWN